MKQCLWMPIAKCDINFIHKIILSSSNTTSLCRVFLDKFKQGNKVTFCSIVFVWAGIYFYYPQCCYDISYCRASLVTLDLLCHHTVFQNKALLIRINGNLILMIRTQIEKFPSISWSTHKQQSQWRFLLTLLTCGNVLIMPDLFEWCTP